MQKIQLNVAINGISTKDNDEECVMHSKIDNIEFMIYDNTDEVIEELFDDITFLQIPKWIGNISERQRFYLPLGSFLVLKINPNCGESVTLNHEKIGKYSKRIIKITTLINKYKLEGINYTSEKDDWKIFEKKNPHNCP